MLLTFLLLIFGIFISANLNKFNHCFDRYPGRKIIGGQFIQPFHSEWRIGGGEDRCIDFCIRSLSRCASIVFDKHEHICHYFTIGDINNIVPARGFVYLKLKSKECIGKSRKYCKMSNNPKNITKCPITQDVTKCPITQKYYKMSIPSLEPKLEENNNRTNTIIPPIIIKSRREETVTYLPINTTQSTTTEKNEPEKQQRVEEFFVNEEEQSYITTINNKSKLKEEEENKDSKNFFEEIDKELQQMEENQQSEEENNQQEAEYEETNLMMPTVSMLKIKKRPNKQLLGEEPEIRRHPRLDNNINYNIENNYWKTKNQQKIKQKQENTGCGIGKQPIWLAVENARFNARTTKEFSINAETSKECSKICTNNSTINFIDENGRSKRCNAFSYNENEKLCEFAYSNIEFPSTLVQSSDEVDFTQRAFRLLCYSATFSPFTGCSEFVAFMDYRLSDISISPKELYDGLPKNVQGLSACIELCVLSNDFECLSGFFDALKGRCTLYDVNSLSNPSSFCKHSGNGHQLYFENGCAEPDKNNILNNYA